MKKWTQDELLLCVEYINNGLSYQEIAEKTNKTKQSVRLKLNKLNIYSIPRSKTIEKKCICCNKIFTSLISENRKFCSSSCSATINNKIFIKKKKKIDILEKPNNTEKEINKCINCCTIITLNNKKYCSNNCFQEHRKIKLFQSIENGEKKITQRNYKKYLIHKFGNSCMECGWNKKNIYTNSIPIELEHIDGNSENNSLENLKLLCPNCHSLTATYKGANRGNGRHYRKKRFHEGKSY